MTNKTLINSLIEEGYLKSPIIVEAFKNVDRADFVPKEMKQVAYSNQALPIGHDQTISQPLTVAFLLEKLEPKTGDTILDIGTGSGWQASLIAYIISKNDTSNKSKVVTVERIPELKQVAEKNIEKYGFIKKGIIESYLGNGSEGYEEHAPYNKIISAASAESLPEAWKDQVVTGGRIVTPIGHSIYTFEKIAEDEFVKEQHFGFSFVPLVN